MFKRVLLLFIFIVVSVSSRAQHLGMTFQEAEDHGLTLPHLDSVYKSAVHVDTSLAVFKTAQEQDSLQSAYIQLLQEFGNFLAENEFVWEKRTPCYNRIYFSADGGIDYFLFNFLGKPEYQPSPAQQAEFKRLLNEFIQDYQFGVTASIKFAQFSPTTYMP